MQNLVKDEENKSISVQTLLLKITNIITEKTVRSPSTSFKTPSSKSSIIKTFATPKQFIRKVFQSLTIEKLQTKRSNGL